jgi:hypothetical protein
MFKSIRSIAFVALVSLVITPSLSAENMGTNPKPRKPSVVLITLASAAHLLFGL